MQSWRRFAVSMAKEEKILTAEQQRQFAREFLEKIEAMPKKTFIGGFNDAVRRGGADAVKEWWKSKGSKFKMPSLGKSVTTAGRVGGRALAVVGNVEVAQDAWIASHRPDRTCPYVTYYFEDEHGQYHYEQHGSGFGYRGTDAVYDTGDKAGERVPTFWFWGWIKVYIKRFTNPPDSEFPWRPVDPA
jgi:hypothetical protein